MEKILNRYRCVTDDGCDLDVIEYQHFKSSETEKGVRNNPGARRLVTANGKAVRYIDKNTFEIIDTGELVRREN